MTLISPRKAFPPSPAGAIPVLYIAGIPATLSATNCRSPQKAVTGRCPRQQTEVTCRLQCVDSRKIPKFSFKVTFQTPPFPPVFDSACLRRSQQPTPGIVSRRLHFAALLAKRNGYTRCEGKTRAAAARCMQGPRRRHGFAADIARRRWRCARRLRRRQRKRRRKRLDAAACEKSPALFPVRPHSAAPRSSPAYPATSKLCPSQPPWVNVVFLIAVPGSPLDWGQSQRSRHGQPILPDASAYIVQIRPLGHLPHAGAAR